MFIGYEMPDPPVGARIPMPKQPVDYSPIPGQPVGQNDTYPPQR